MPRKKELLPPPLPANKLARAIIDSATSYPPDKLFKWSVEHLLAGLGASVVSQYPEDAADNVGSIVSFYLSEVRRNQPFVDILGPARIALATYWPLDEQVSSYTPEPVAELMAQSKYSQLSAGEEGAHPAAISDPACGNGTVLLSLMRVLVRQTNSKQLREWSVVASDKNILNVQVCAVQFLTNAAVHELSPGNFSARHYQPAKDKEGETILVEMKYIIASGQHEIMKPGSTWAGSAQQMLI